MAKILLVEDDNNLREIYEARLMAEGYEIVSAKDGEEALVVAKQEQPDLVIADVMMPRISGFEMLDILRNTEGLHDVKVIMLTALGQAEDKTRADKLGADRYLVKSQVTLEDIVKAASDLVGPGGSPPSAAGATPGQAAAPQQQQAPQPPTDQQAAPAAPVPVQPAPQPQPPTPAPAPEPQQDAPATPPAATPTPPEATAASPQPRPNVAAPAPDTSQQPTSQPAPAETNIPTAQPSAPTASQATNTDQLASAVNDLVNSTNSGAQAATPAAAQPAPAAAPQQSQQQPQPTVIQPAPPQTADNNQPTRQSDPSDDDIENDSVTIARKKVIKPLDAASAPRQAGLDELIAKEDAKNAGTAPPPLLPTPINNPAPFDPSAHPPGHVISPNNTSGAPTSASPGQSAPPRGPNPTDPNSISL